MRCLSWLPINASALYFIQQLNAKPTAAGDDLIRCFQERVGLCKRSIIFTFPHSLGFFFSAHINFIIFLTRVVIRDRYLTDGEKEEKNCNQQTMRRFVSNFRVVCPHSGSVYVASMFGNHFECHSAVEICTNLCFPPAYKFIESSKHESSAGETTAPRKMIKETRFVFHSVFL